MRREVDVGVVDRDGKRMAVGIPIARPPVAKPGALFEAGIALPDKVGLGQSNALQGRPHGWPGAFTHADSRHIR